MTKRSCFALAEPYSRAFASVTEKLCTWLSARSMPSRVRKSRSFAKLDSSCEWARARSLSEAVRRSGQRATSAFTSRSAMPFTVTIAVGRAAARDALADEPAACGDAAREDQGGEESLGTHARHRA